ncbi:MAG TPA: HD-GYP domain-containing protein [Dehalococcoidia bacterium]|nr:HD-GYP domain-containing protein [Dehalococcoidia bacterium]
MTSLNHRAGLGKPVDKKGQQQPAWPLWLFFGTQLVAAAAILALDLPRLQGDVALFGFLLVLNVAAELLPINVYQDSYVSVGFVLTVALIVLYGIPGVIIAAIFEAVAGRLGDKHRLDFRTVTNAARFVVVYWASALAYRAFAPIGPETVTAGVAAGVAAATITCYGLSALLLSVSVALRTGATVRAAWSQHGSWVAPHYAAMGVLGLALVASYLALGWLGIAAFATPALMMRFVMKQYTDKTKENVEKLKAQNAELQVANIEVRRVSDELRETYDGTLEALVNALDARDQETKGHSLRVSHYMLDIAREIGVVEGTEQWTDMARGSLLHDVGKIGVSDTILLKPAKLTDDEWKLMRLHPEIGYNMLHQVKFLEGAAEIILAHHERWDGKGYPRGLHEEDIPLGARIFMVCDTFDSMTSDRPYRRALTTLDALNEILKNSGSQFDPQVVEAFLDIYETWVKEREELHSQTDLRRAA